MQTHWNDKKKKTIEDLMTYKEKVFFICLGYTKNPCDADDLTQDIYLKALKKLDSLKDKNLAKVWILRICRNTCLDHLKKMRLRRLFSLKTKEDIIIEQTPESQIITHQQIQKVKASIQQLPKKLKETLVLREYGDLSYQEISQTLGIKAGTVMSRLNRARQALSNIVKGNHHD